MVSHELLLRTALQWKISPELAREVLARDLACIYCNRSFEDLSGQRAGLASWEHIINDLTLVDVNNIALCCVGCNSSKGTKALEAWLDSAYCKVKGITRSSIAPVAASVLRSSASPLAQPPNLQ